MTEKEKGKSTDAFSSWYAKHKKTFNEQRRERYKNDTEYRQKALDNARKTRQRVGARPEQYSVSMLDLASRLDIPVWTLRNWKGNLYFPEPAKFNGAMWFTEHQAQLIARLADYFKSNAIARLSYDQKKQVSEIVTVIYQNWG